jgi:NADH dehydrogenase [ubiquinone] 1 alpha subcomplex assembly factor 7
VTTPLKDILVKRIEATGPITLADYMAECLMHPKHGYYTQETVFGANGDFITAPEVSQMFGEMMGLWLADRWYKMDKPEGVQLIELGPGRGTLMADILRATEPVVGFHDAIKVHFVETSGQLRALQAKKVPQASWHDDLSSIPDGPTLLVANEFFDALPIHQFEKHDGRWCERRVHAENDELKLVLTSTGPKFALTNPALHNHPEGSVLEACPAALSISASIAQRLFAGGGAAIILDYGYRKSTSGDSFQALQNHQYCNAFEAPGEADLTAHVAFDQLAAAAKDMGAFTYGPAAQGPFLMALGIGERAQQLAAANEGAENGEGSEDGIEGRILSELTRLTSADEMGSLFKVLALQDPKLPPPPGF